MPPCSCACAAVRSSAEAQAAIRRLSAGRTVWAAEDLAELARLQREWQAAVARETELAA